MKKFVCGVTFQHEIGETDCTGFFYDTLDAIKEQTSCWEQCGIVEVEFDGPNDPETLEEIKSFKWVEPQDMGWGTKS
jgi:isopentenyldiphosphate isomerase